MRLLSILLIALIASAPLLGKEERPVPPIDAAAPAEVSRAVFSLG